MSTIADDAEAEWAVFEATLDADPDLADLQRTARALHETDANPEQGPYYLHDTIADEALVADFLDAFVPVVSAAKRGDVTAGAQFLAAVTAFFDTSEDDTVDPGAAS